MKRKEAPFHDQLIRAVAYAEDLDRLTERVSALEAAAKPQASPATPALPTDPGTVFWGVSDSVGPCWWFVVRNPSSGIRYVADDGTVLVASAAEARSLREVPR